MTTACCPTCGQTLRDMSTLLVSLDTNTAARNGIDVHLSPIQTVMLHVLAESAPKRVSIRRLLASIYGAGEGPEDGLRSLRTHMHHLRRKLAPLGIKIVAVWGEGYHLADIDKPVARAA